MNWHKIYKVASTYQELMSYGVEVKKYLSENPEKHVSMIIDDLQKKSTLSYK